MLILAASCNQEQLYQKEFLKPASLKINSIPVVDVTPTVEPTFADCGEAPHGSIEEGQFFQSAVVPFGQQCVTVMQQRTCNNGDWGSWNGNLTARTCVVEPAAACNGKPHGSMESAQFFSQEVVPYSQQCQPVTQTRICNNGAWGAWNGNLTLTSCRRADPLPCGNNPSGMRETKQVYNSAVVPFGQLCQGLTVDRLCTDGQWSAWSGDTTIISCRVADPLSCDGIVHGQTQSGDFFPQAVVAPGQECIPISQTRTCNNGVWGNWSGRLTIRSCSITPYASCDGVIHGGTQYKNFYASEVVPFGKFCQTVPQARTCNNGVWGSWSGNLTVTSCRIADPIACQGLTAQISHGQYESANFYASAVVPYGQQCQAVSQKRLCTNGTLGAWNGGLTAMICNVANPLPCGDVAHGGTQAVDFYSAAVVPYGQECLPISQSRTCTNGSWGTWSGSLTLRSCQVAPAPSCDGVANGNSQSAQFYANAVVPYGQQCLPVNQSRTCNAGIWSAWSGNLIVRFCQVAAPLSCDGVAHGQSQSSNFYPLEVVPYGGQCTPVSQSRTCNNGVWGAWSGNLTITSCQVNPPASCNGVASGQSQTNNFYALAVVPFGGQCVPVAQSRSCTNGVWSNWSGSLTLTSCRVADQTLANQIDSFSQNHGMAPKVDILWVIDNSGSMADDQANLASNFETFISGFITRDVDFKMAITTTDAWYYGVNNRNICKTKSLTSAAAASNRNQFISDFQSCVKVGTGGYGMEEGLKSGQMYLDALKSTFLRQDAYLIVVILSDEEEQSTKAVSQYVDELKALKGQGGLLKIYSICRTVVAPNVSGEVRSGIRYMDASKLSGGIYSDIDQDFYTTLNNISDRIVSLVDSFALSHAPYLNQITVKVNGLVVTSGWVYDPISRSIKFNAGSLPPEGATVEISYRYATQ
ncbi:MAG: vWA domain-containing protein [Pseudomonadota bacterium]